MVWDEKSKEGSDGAELQLFQVGTPLSDLTVKFAISGTAKNKKYLILMHEIGVI